MSRKLQFVWWGFSDRDAWWRWGFERTKPADAMSLIYRWFLFLGPLEVRRWLDAGEDEAAMVEYRKAADSERKGV